MTDVHAEAGPSQVKAAAAIVQATTMPIRLTSKTQKHALPDSRFMIPSDWRRFQLSELINKVLAHDQAVPFDFIIDGELLRTSLGAFAKAKGLTEESILEVEYVESILPPKSLSSFQQADWVSDIDLTVKDSFLTACYDGAARVFSASGQVTHVIQNSTLPILSSCWLPHTHGQSSGVATAGMDRIVRIWKTSNDSHISKNTHALHLHGSSVASVRSAATPSTSSNIQLITAGWDGLVGYWDFNDDIDHRLNGADAEGEDDADGPRKRRRRGANGAASAGSDKATRIEPTLVLRGHTGQVSKAVFDRSSRKAFSFGLDDHSVREWDLDAGGVQIGIKQSDKAIMAAEQLASPNLLVTGNADRTITVFDMRDSASIISLTLTGHASSVAAVSAHPTSPLLLCSGSYDGTVRIWDARSPKQALFSVQRQQPKQGKPSGKIICTAWDGDIVASGGEDGRLDLAQSKGLADGPRS